MRNTFQFLLAHSYTVLVAVVFLEQAGLPIPAAPLLIGIGALAATGRIDAPTAFFAALTAAMAGDLIWYALGRKRGRPVLRLLCRVSLEPDSCVRSTENAYARFGSAALIMAKFVPGLNTAAPPLAGLVGMSWARFLLYDGLGAAIWVGAFLGLGFVFHNQLDPLLLMLETTGAWFVAIAAAGLVFWIGFKFWQRARFIRKLRVARIRPEEVRERIERGENLLIVDLRGSAEPDGARLPGARAMSLTDLEERHHELPRDRDVILYCS